jgi:hypothetical protein
MREAFAREIGAGAAVDHRNVLRIVSRGELERRSGERYLFVVTDYCPDGDYRSVLTSQPPGTILVATICSDFLQILAGLTALHERIIHRDLKPENVLRSGEVLKVGDFGLSKFVDEATRTLTFKGGGTPRYMAPEVWERRRAVPASDLYAIGVMMFEGATGRPPFDAPDLIGLRDLHLYEPAPRVRSIRPDVPDRLDGIIRKLLEKDATKRYQTAREVSAALNAVTEVGSQPALREIAERIRRNYDAREQQRLAAQGIASREQDQRARNQYMERQLLALIDEVVEEVNAQIEEVKIVRRLQGQNAVYQLGGRAMHIKFFESGELYADPEVPGRMETLRKRHVVHGGFIEIREGAQDREGWNVVLVRPPDSSYGEWIIVETEVSALTGKSTRFSPVATEARLFADNLACHWMPAMHVFQLKDKPLERTDVEKILHKLVP